MMRYRLVMSGEIIEPGDEVLTSGCTTWEPKIIGAPIGMQFHPMLMRPMRRPMIDEKDQSDGGK